jgi:hypothetical protein
MCGRNARAARLVGGVVAALTAVSPIYAVSVDDIFTRMRAQTITGVTVITHGYQFFDSGGDSLMPLATSVQNRIQGIYTATGNNDRVWLLDYDVADDGGQGIFDDANPQNRPGAGDNGLSGHLVLLYDWAAESNETRAGWGEPAGDALFSMLVGLGAVDPARCPQANLHLIGHSFGTAVTSEAAERLARFRIPVANLTYLDPHDFDQPNIEVDEDQRLFDLGRPPGHGATVWNNVNLADTYYQTRGTQGSIVAGGTNDPLGRPTPGAFNRHLDGADELPAGNPYGVSTDSDHSYVWHTFYQSTVEGRLRGGATAPAAFNTWNTTGWNHSVFANPQAAQPAPIFYGATQDHRHSEAALVDRNNGQPNNAGLNGLGLNAAQVTQGRFAPQWNPAMITSGDFGPGESYGVSDVSQGWSHHGGGGDGDVESEDVGGQTNFYLELNFNDAERTHNRLYIPYNATHLKYRRRLQDGSDNDTFRVRIGDQAIHELTNYPDADNTWNQNVHEIPPALRGTTATITFEILADGALNTVDSEIGIDDVMFQLAAAQLAAQPAAEAMIDFGVLRPGEMRTLADAVRLGNTGEAGSAMFLTRGLIEGTAPSVNLFTSPDFDWMRLNRGDAAQFDLKFLGSQTNGMYSVRYGFEGSDGSVFYTLKATVIPEPATIVLAMLAPAAFFARRRLSKVQKTNTNRPGTTRVATLGLEWS